MSNSNKPKPPGLGVAAILAASMTIMSTYVHADVVAGNVSYVWSQSNSVSITQPSGAVEGNYLVAQITAKCGDPCASVPPSIATPDGWEQIQYNTQLNNESRPITQGIYGKFVGASESGPYVFTVTGAKASGINGAIVALSGVDASNPVIAKAGYSTTNTKPSISPATLDITSGPGSAILTFLGTWAGYVETSISPTMTSLWQGPIPANDPGTHAWFMSPQTGATSGTPTLSWGNTSRTPIAQSLSLKASTNLTVTVPEVSLSPVTLTASLGSGSCGTGLPITFSYSTDDGDTWIAITPDGSTDASGVATVAWTPPTVPGIYDIKAEFEGTSSCGASEDEAGNQVTVVTALSMANGGGNYFVPEARPTIVGQGGGNGKLATFGFTAEATGSPDAQGGTATGQISWHYHNLSRLRGVITGYSPTYVCPGAVPTNLQCYTVTGTGTLSTRDEPKKQWTVTQEVPFSAIVADGGTSTVCTPAVKGKKATCKPGLKPDWFGIEIDGEVSGEFDPMQLHGGNIRVLGVSPIIPD